MKRLIVKSHQYGKRLLQIFPGSGGKEAKATIYYTIGDDTFHLVIGDQKNPTQLLENHGIDYPSMQEALNDMIDLARASMGATGFSHNDKEYQDAIDYLEAEPTKKVEEKRKKEEQKRQEKQKQEEINKQKEMEQQTTQEEVAPTDEEYDEEINETNEVDNTDNVDNVDNSNNNSSKSENNSKKLKPEWKTIQLIITENEKTLVEGAMRLFIRNDYVHSYSMIPRAPEEGPTPMAKQKTRLRKVLAYVFTGVMDAGQQSGVIKDFDEQFPNVVSLYFSQNTDNENDSSCVGFIINYNNSFIAVGPTFDQELEKIKQSGSSGQGGVNYSFDSFINELSELTSQFGLNQIKKFGDFGQAEGFILGSTTVAKKISLNEAIAGPTQTYNEEEKTKEDTKKDTKQEPQVQLYTLRVHYDSKNPNAIDALEQFIKDIKNDIIQYNPNLK